MLTLAIATFFAFALAGAVLTIGIMFHAYQDKIKAVIVAELGEKNITAPTIGQRSHSSVTKAYRTSPRRRSLQPARLRAAA